MKILSFITRFFGNKKNTPKNSLDHERVLDLSIETTNERNEKSLDQKPTEKSEHQTPAWKLAFKEIYPHGASSQVTSAFKKGYRAASQKAIQNEVDEFNMFFGKN